MYLNAFCHLCSDFEIIICLTNKRQIFLFLFQDFKKSWQSKMEIFKKTLNKIISQWQSIVQKIPYESFFFPNKSKISIILFITLIILGVKDI